MVINGGLSVNEIARDLGIDSNLLYRWKRELTKVGTDAFPGKGRLSPQEEELHRPRRELSEAMEDREIFKKALAFFSKNGKLGISSCRRTYTSGKSVECAAALCKPQ
jgi:transposase